jgi:hypothetical protein
MDERMTAALDELTGEQAGRLLDGDIKLKISNKDLRRIKNAVLEKAGMKERKCAPKQLPAIAALVVV